MRQIWADQPGMAGLLRQRETEVGLFERGLETAVPEPALAAAGIHAESALGDAAQAVGGRLLRVLEAPTRDMIFALERFPA